MTNPDREAIEREEPADRAELLPCPFCGSPAEALPRNPTIEGNAWARVHCTNEATCGVLLPRQFSDTDPFAIAIAAWNTRQPAEAGLQKARTWLAMFVAESRAHDDREITLLNYGRLRWLAKEIGPFTPPRPDTRLREAVERLAGELEGQSKDCNERAKTPLGTWHIACQSGRSSAYSDAASRIRDILEESGE